MAEDVERGGGGEKPATVVVVVIEAKMDQAVQRLRPEDAVSARRCDRCGTIAWVRPGAYRSAARGASSG